MHPRERQLLIAVYRRKYVIKDRPYVRDICNEVGNYKQNVYYLIKWTRRGWYDWGVSVDLGWLTEKGIEAACSLPADEGQEV